MHSISLVLGVSQLLFFGAQAKLEYAPTNAPDQHISWAYTPESISEITQKIVVEEKRLFDSIAAVETVTLELVFYPYAEFKNAMMPWRQQIAFLRLVSPDAELRLASVKAVNLINENDFTQTAREDVYNVFARLAHEIATGGITNLDAEDTRYINKIMNRYRRAGWNLDQETRDKVRQIQLDLGRLSGSFYANTMNKQEYMLFSAEELDGVPSDIVDAFPRVGDKYKVTFIDTDYVPVLEYAKNQDTRRQMFTNDSNRCAANERVLEEMIEKRFQLAKLLGYNSYTDYALEGHLANNKSKVVKFLDDVKNRVKPMEADEVETLLLFKNAKLQAPGQSPQQEFYHWDFEFYDQLMLKELYNVDHELISEYFPIQETIKRMFDIYERLFDLEFVEVTDASPGQKWHEDVRIFDMYEDVLKGKVYAGTMYLDLHPREDKFSTFANFVIGGGFVNSDGSRQTSSTALVCTFSKPTKTKPALLRHSEMVTFFHELGHGIHALLSETKFEVFHGNTVEPDVLELTSQAFEYWIWSRDQLKLISSHYETGEPLGDDIIDKLVASKSVNSGIRSLRQLLYAYLDIELHSISTQQELDALDMQSISMGLTRDLFSLSTGGSTFKFYTAFMHIAGRYASAVYGYLYSRVYSADIFHTLFANDPLNAEQGARFRDTVLKRGGTRDMMENLVTLLGRRPNSDAFAQFG